MNTPLLRRVLIVLLDESRYVGMLYPFNPEKEELLLEITNSNGTGTRQLTILTESIGYIAYYSTQSNPATPPIFQQQMNLRIYVIGDVSYLVAIEHDHIESPSGFHAFSFDRNSEFDEFFFFPAGIAITENIEPLGSMLIESGLIEEDSIRQAVERQSENRKIPIGELLIQLNQVTTRDVEQARQIQARKAVRLGEVLVEMGLVTPDEVERALIEQKSRREKRLGEILVDMGVLSEQALFQTLARKFRMPFVDLDDVALNSDAIQIVGRSLIAKHNFLPLDLDENRVTIAIPDPLNTAIHDVIRFHLGLQVQEVLAAPTQLKRFIENIIQYDPSQQLPDAPPIEMEPEEDAHDSTAPDPELDSFTSDPNNIVINLVNQMIIDAYRAGASDIHIEPNGNQQPVLIRFRIDGECSIYKEISADFRLQMLARIKIMARLDISEKRRPQDGKIRFAMGNDVLELRAASIPTVNRNEDIVLRLLASSKPLPLDRMGLDERNLTELRRIIAKPYGIVLCVGPTGSGKTTMLHSALSAVNQIDTKIWTIEDPVEITQSGLRQVQVNSKIDLTFANALRAFLRADPDIIMIGEMRDLETASAAIEASLTGHLVFSTLHTNSAVETVTRLLDMGINHLTFSDSLLGILAVRLVRSLCKHCRKSYLATDAERAVILDSFSPNDLKRQIGILDPNEIQLWKAGGCDACRNTGFKGRFGIQELLVGTPAIKSAILKRALITEIQALAVSEGMRTLRQDGIAKALAGKTELKLVLAVC